MQDVFNKSIQYEIIDFSSENRENEEKDPELQIDLEKSHMLHKERLVQKRVPVRHGNGKVTYRMQWVKTGKQPVKPDKQTQHQPPVPQGAHQDIKDHLSKIKPISTKKHDQLKHSTQPIDKNRFKSDWEYFKQNVHPMHRENLEQEDAQRKGKKGYNDWKQGKMGLLLPHDPTSQEANKLHETLVKNLSKAYKGIQANKEHVINAVTSSIQQDDNSDEFIKNRQLTTLKTSMQMAQSAVDSGYPEGMFTLVGMHPDTLSHTLKSLLGEKKYTELHGRLQSSNLTINCNPNHMNNIFKDGYSIPSAYSQLSKDAQDFLKSRVEPLSNVDDKIKAVNDYADGIDSGNQDHYEMSVLGQRMTGESKFLGVPTSELGLGYIALNANGSKEGAAPQYGTGVVHVNEAALNNCTAGYSEDFNSKYPVPKVYNMEHLKDLYILKGIINEKVLNDDWGNGSDFVEVHYHSQDGKIPSEYLGGVSNA